MNRKGLFSGVAASSASLWVLGTATAGALGEDRVRVRGGSDPGGHIYEWTVFNDGSAPIIEVRIPQYRASVCSAPDGWTTEESTFVVNVGVPNRAGECVARVQGGGMGLAPGKSGVFGAQISAGGAVRAGGVVRVRFGDGSEAVIAGVEVPQPEPAGDRYISLIGLAAIFAVLIAVQSFRKRRVQGQGRSIHDGNDRGKP